jgi:hypothetical protein
MTRYGLVADLTDTERSFLVSAARSKERGLRMILGMRTFALMARLDAVADGLAPQTVSAVIGKVDAVQLHPPHSGEGEH